MQILLAEQGENLGVARRVMIHRAQPFDRILISILSDVQHAERPVGLHGVGCSFKAATRLASAF